MIDWLHAAVAWLLYIILLLIPVALAIWLVMKGFERFRPDAGEGATIGIGCPLIAIVTVLLLLLMAPALDAVKHVACEQAEDYRRCMDPD